MKEIEYVNTTNLTKLRFTRSLVADVLPDDKIVKSENIRDICMYIDSLITKLEEVVKCD